MLHQPQAYGLRTPSLHGQYQQQQTYEQRPLWQQQQLGTYSALQPQPQSSPQPFVQSHLQVQATTQDAETNQQRLRRQQRQLLLLQRRQPPLSPPALVPSMTVGQAAGPTAAAWPAAMGQTLPPRPPPSPGPGGLSTVSFSLPRAATLPAVEHAVGMGRLMSLSAPSFGTQSFGSLLAQAGDRITPRLPQVFVPASLCDDTVHGKCRIGVTSLHSNIWATPSACASDPWCAEDPLSSAGGPPYGARADPIAVRIPRPASVALPSSGSGDAAGADMAQDASADDAVWPGRLDRQLTTACPEQ